MAQGASDFVSATAAITTSVAPFTTQTTLLDSYIIRPSKLTFADTELIQPTAQLASINQLTDL